MKAVLQKCKYILICKYATQYKNRHNDIAGGLSAMILP